MESITGRLKEDWSQLFLDFLTGGLKFNTGRFPHCRIG